MPEPSNLNAEIAAKVLEANVRNIVEKVKAGGTLNASERAIMETAATKKPETPLQESEAAAAAAPFLFSAEDLGAERLEATGEFTGERLLARKPEVYRAVVRMAAEGQSISATARALSVSRNTVAAVREREGISIEHEKKELLRDVRRAARLSVERAIELVPSIQNAKDAAIVAAVMVDKMQLLSGEATSRIERVDADQDKLRDMLAALPVLEAEVIPATGSQGNGSEQKAALPGVLVAVAESVTDTESDVLTDGQKESGELSATLSATSDDAGAELAGGLASLRGGEGVAIFEGGPHDTTDSGEQKILSKGALDAPHS